MGKKYSVIENETILDSTDDLKYAVTVAYLKRARLLENDREINVKEYKEYILCKPKIELIHALQDRVNFLNHMHLNYKAVQNYIVEKSKEEVIERLDILINRLYKMIQ